MAVKKGRKARRGQHWKGKKFSTKHRKAISKAIKAWWASGRRKKSKTGKATKVNRSTRKTAAKKYKDGRRNRSAARKRASRTNSKIGWRTLKKDMASKPKSTFKSRKAAGTAIRKPIKINRIKKR